MDTKLPKAHFTGEESGALKRQSVVYTEHSWAPEPVFYLFGPHDPSPVPPAVLTGIFDALDTSIHLLFHLCNRPVKYVVSFPFYRGEN